MKRYIYVIAFDAIDGVDVVAFESWADAMNFTMDIQDHVFNMAMAIEEEEALQ